MVSRQVSSKLNRLFSVKAASNYSGYNIQYIRRLLRLGVLPGIKIGHMWVIEKGNIDELIQKSLQANDLRRGPRGRVG